MNRRNFLQRLAPAGAVGTALVALGPLRAESGDDFHFLGWRVVWSGWRDPVNQMISIGFWSAHRPGDERVFYSTSLGVCDETREANCLDVHRCDGWPLLNHLSTDAERLAVQLRAKNALLAKLRDNVFTPEKPNPSPEFARLKRAIESIPSLTVTE